MESMKERLSITKDWLPRYTGMEIDEFGDYILLTNFSDYLIRFAEMFDCDIKGQRRPMQAATNLGVRNQVMMRKFRIFAPSILESPSQCFPKLMSMETMRHLCINF